MGEKIVTINMYTGYVILLEKRRWQDSVLRLNLNAGLRRANLDLSLFML